MMQIINSKKKLIGVKLIGMCLILFTGQRNAVKESTNLEDIYNNIENLIAAHNSQTVV